MLCKVFEHDYFGLILATLSVNTICVLSKAFNADLSSFIGISTVFRINLFSLASVKLVILRIKLSILFNFN